MAAIGKKQNLYIWLAISGLIIAVAVMLLLLFLSKKDENNMTEKERAAMYSQIQDQIVENVKEQGKLLDKHFTCEQLEKNYQKNSSDIDCAAVMARWNELKNTEQELRRQQDQL